MTSGPPAPYWVGAYASSTASTTFTVPLTNPVNGGDCIVVCITPTWGADPTLDSISDDAGNGYTTYSGSNGTLWLIANPVTSGGLLAQQNLYITLSASTNVTVEVVGVPNVEGYIAVGGADSFSPNSALQSIPIDQSGNTGLREITLGVWADSEYQSDGVTAVNCNLLTSSFIKSSVNGYAGVAWIASDVDGNVDGYVTTTTGAGTWTVGYFTFQCGVPYIENEGLNSGVVGTAYSQTINVMGFGTNSCSLYSGALPGGLTLSSTGGVSTITGTPTTAGEYTITLEATDSLGSNTTTYYTFIINILPLAVSGVPALSTSAQANGLSPADADFETGTFTWAPFLNAGSPEQVDGFAATGSYSLMWNATADGDTAIATGYYPCSPGPYIASGLMVPRSYIGAVAVGMAFYNGTTLLETQYGTQQGQAATTNGWLPCTGQFIAPATTTQCRMIAYAYDSYAGDIIALDTCHMMMSTAQILVDWVNSSFSEGATGGQMFMDISPWVDWDNGIDLQRGRQDRVSEVQAGTATWKMTNDSGYFTKFSTQALANAVGGQCDIGRRYQVNATDEAGSWYTRADGPLSGIDYSFDESGNTSAATATGTDVLAPLSRQDVQTCWTREQIFYDAAEYGLDYHWSLDDAGNAGGAGVATETSGNQGPPMRLKNTDSTGVATIAWQSTNGGIETLADSVAAGQPDGSEYWNEENPQLPGTDVRGLDASALGPYTSPLGSVYFTPVVTVESAHNQFYGNLGYYLQTQLPSPITDDVEFWFTMDPTVAPAANTHVGPFVPVSIAESKTGRTITVGINMNSSDILFEATSWAKPPGYAGITFGTAVPGSVASLTTPIHSDTVQIPHHVVLQFWDTTGDGYIIKVWLDGALVGDIPWPSFFEYDIVTAGGCYGGGGAHAGGVQLISLWNQNLSESIIRTHCAMGQYGMFEKATDTCISTLVQYCNVPAYWNNTSRNIGNGLTLADYLDLSGSNGLANMQLYEQAEQGELFVNAAGQLTFATRDVRMGYHAPDLYLPPDSFDAGLGYQLNDQFLVNEAAVSTQIFSDMSEEQTSYVSALNGQYVSTTSGAFINNASQDQYGIYAPNPVSSPLILPLFTFSRAGVQLGQPSFAFDTVPYLYDWAAWSANSQSVPWMMPGVLTVDLLTVDPSWGINISDFYALEIGSMIAPSGTLPNSFPSTAASVEWFIEGINEHLGLEKRTIQFYCSPAEQQRAWIPGDPTYGQLDSTALIGVSQYDTHATAALYKDVSHDAGGAYWPPSFTQWMNSPRLQDLANTVAGIGMWPLDDAPVLNANGDFSSGDTSGWYVYEGTLTYVASPPTGAGTNATCPTTQCGSFVNTNGYYGNASQDVNGYFVPVTPGRYYYVTAMIYFAPGTSPSNELQFGLNTIGASNNYIGDVANNVTGIPAGQWTPIGSLVQIPEGESITQCAPLMGMLSAVPLQFYFTNVRVQEVTGGFVGANDIRGLAEPLTNMVNPPKMIARQLSSSQPITAAGPTTPTIIGWDTVDADTAGGLGLCPGYPSWYVCLVPGFYDIDHSVAWNETSATGHLLQSFVVVARNAMQSVAAGTGLPQTAGVYVSPSGASAASNGSGVGLPPVTSGATRLYLGFGDMVAIAANCDVAQSTYGSGAATQLSILYRGQCTEQDGVQFNELIQGGTVTNNVNTVGYTGTYKCTQTQLYYGSQKSGASAAKAGNRRESNADLVQGYAKAGKKYGSQVGLVTLPYATIAEDLSASGTSIKSVWLEFSTPPAWTPPKKKKGGKPKTTSTGTGADPKQAVVMLGWSDAPGGASFNVYGASGRDHPDKHRVTYRTSDKTKHFRVRLPNEFATAFANGAQTLMVGNGSSTGNQYLIHFNAAVGSWTLIIDYEVTP